MTTARELPFLMDLDSGEQLSLLWAPNDLVQEVTSKMARPEIPGSSHSPSQFLQTENEQIPFSFVIDADNYEGNDVQKAARVDQARQFVLSLQYPRSSTRAEGAGKPLCLLVIPNNLTKRGYVDRVRVTHEELFDNLAARRIRVEVTFVEELNQRLTSSQVRRMRMSQGGPLGPASFIGGRLPR